MKFRVVKGANGEPTLCSTSIFEAVPPADSPLSVGRLYLRQHPTMIYFHRFCHQ
jgi:hypothetical protein